MKKGFLVFKDIFLVVLLLVAFSVQGLAQKETRKERKAREKKEQAAMFEVAKQLVKDSTFVIPVDRIVIKGGVSSNVLNTINFIKVYKDKGVLQIAPTHSSNLGANGLGGITMNGNITKYEVKDKGDKIYVTVYLKDTLGHAIMNISLYGSTNVTVDVSGMFSGPAFTMYGKINPLGDVHVFEGSSF